MVYLEVKKGKNQFNRMGSIVSLPCLYVGKSHWQGSVGFLESAKYKLDAEDQQDTNKGYGVSWNILDNHDVSVMLGWRYNPATDEFELTFYGHNGEYPKRIWLEDAEGSLMFPVKTKMNRQVFYSIAIEDGWVTCWFDTEDGSAPTKYKLFKPYKKLSGLQRRVEYWFGGDDSNKDGLGGQAPTKLALFASFKSIK